MLKQLRIQNYAIIDALEINFSNRLNIITGETGAGKSILMGALSLILGERADSAVLRNTEKKCFIEGVFAVANKPAVTDFFIANELDAEDELVIRREIAASGRSRGFINDSPATLQQLKELASLLVDLHQQFDTLELGDEAFQREALDALAGNGLLLQQYQKSYGDWQQQQAITQALQQQKAGFNKELDYNQFLFDELQEANFSEDELENSEQELQLLSHAEDIKTVLEKTAFELHESEQPVTATLKQLANQLQQLSSYHASLDAVAARLKAAQIELQDVADEIEHINSSVQFDEKRVDFINNRLAAGYKLLKKHQVKTTNELLAIKNALEEKLQVVLNIDEAISEAEKKSSQLLNECSATAGELSKKRAAQIKPFEQNVNSLLKQVGMPNAVLRVEQLKTELNQFGKDNIQFLFDANKSNRFEPLRKVASGGELSRLMLCIKSLVAESIDLPTMIFDEIDTGISGEAAKQVGIIMKQLATKRQVISITHQPQIAGKADAHFFVYKKEKNRAINTNIRLLTKEERINAIAQMLSGEKPTAAALENAKEMVN